MRVLVTGGTGFLGRHVAWRLKREGHDVVVMGRNDSIGALLQSAGIDYIKADLTEASRVIGACAGRDQVIHSGGLASPWGDFDAFHRANVVGTRNVIEGCRRHGVHRLLYLSTPSLYFDYRHRLGIKESDPLPRPVTAYAATKMVADEDVAKANAEGLATISFRPRAIFGPGDQAVLPRLLRAAERGRIPLIGGGKSFVDLTYIDNVVDAICLGMTAPEAAWGKIYNLTNGEPLAVKAMMDLVLSSVGKKSRYVPMPFPVAYAAASTMEGVYKALRRTSEPPLTRYAVGLMAKSQTLDITAARTDLGYVPRVSLREGMSHFAQWWNGDRRNSASLAGLGLSNDA